MRDDPSPVGRWTWAGARPWAAASAPTSATFAGSRFDLAMVLANGDAAEAWIAGLGEVDLPMPRQFAREVRITAREDDGERIALRVAAVVLEDVGKFRRERYLADRRASRPEA